MLGAFVDIHQKVRKKIWYLYNVPKYRNIRILQIGFVGTYLFMYFLILETQEDTSAIIDRRGLPPSYSQTDHRNSIYIINTNEKIEEMPPPTYDQAVMIKVQDQ